MQKLFEGEPVLQGLPPLALKRTTADFHVGQPLLYLVDGELHDSTVNHVQETRGVRPPSSGFLRLHTPGQKPTYKTPFSIIDVERNEIVPQDAWERIKTDSDYREGYLSNGPKESLRRRKEFEQAIDLRIATEKHVSVKTVQTKPGRARPRRYDSQLLATSY